MPHARGGCFFSDQLTLEAQYITRKHGLEEFLIARPYQHFPAVDSSSPEAIVAET